MGRTTKWLKSVLGLKKSDHSPSPSPSSNQRETAATPLRAKEKPRRWGFVKSYREKGRDPHTASLQRTVPYGNEFSTSSSCCSAATASGHDPQRCAVAVAAATAAAAEAAVAAAQAAAQVVRLTNSGRSITSFPVSSRSGFVPVEVAAIKIQSAFRGYLARRALRALKALVKLQALVRGHIERKRTTEWLRRMQALLRAQERAKAGRAVLHESPRSHNLPKTSTHFNQSLRGPPTPEKHEQGVRTKSGKYDQSFMLKRTPSKSSNRGGGDEERVHSSSLYFDRRIDEFPFDQRVPSRRIGAMDECKNDKIVEMDTGKFYAPTRRGHLYNPLQHSVPSEYYPRSYSMSQGLSPCYGDIQSFYPLEYSTGMEEVFCTAENSPQFQSESSMGGVSKRSPFTPTKSDGSRSFLSGFSDYPNYMSNTQSSKAKVRSMSAPKQRPQYDRSSSAKRYSIGFGETRSNSAQRTSALRANFGSKAYPGSGRLDDLGMPIGQSY